MLQANTMQINQLLTQIVDMRSVVT